MEAIIQAYDQATISRLQEVSSATEDPEEKAAVLEAIKLMNLPSFTDHLATQDQNPLTRFAKPTLYFQMVSYNAGRPQATPIAGEITSAAAG